MSRVAIPFFTVLVVAVAWAVIAGVLKVDPGVSFLVGMVLGGLAYLGGAALADRIGGYR